jgi:hypothetical protein
MAAAESWEETTGLAAGATEAADKPAQTTIMAKTRTASFIIGNLFRVEVGRRRISVLSRIVDQFQK